ncbi:MAG: glycosyltransferase family 2 protein [Bacteroides sp.]|nr:glycosyltransferase family 2 protein [Prevotella sp.]MCM1408016.1 glycosyltransferase family 2 protein [Treponema brennaborense]MCM1468992.1 glycosyltransferase family 2 protein [Bacteroides sp.]
MTQGFIIPVYNHGKPAAAVTENLLRFEIPIILIDDGSGAETKEILHGLAEKYSCVNLVTLDRNRGKGGAVCAGIDRAKQLGLTHVLQIDADAQHDISRAEFFLEQSKMFPQRMICAYPDFDDSVPASRKNGRKLANFMARLITLSSDITDCMCGFRVYPVSVAYDLIHRYRFDMRMGFDIQILIYLHWQGIPFSFYPVRVVYPAGGISHFHLVRDNVRIIFVFAKCFFGMIMRFPYFLVRKLKRRCTA